MWTKLTTDERQQIIQNITTDSTLQCVLSEVMSEDFTNYVVLHAQLDALYEEYPLLEDLENDIEELCMILDTMKAITAELQLLEISNACPYAHGLLKEDFRNLRKQIGLNEDTEEEEADIIRDLKALGL